MHSLRSKIVLFFIALLSSVIAITLFAVFSASHQQALLRINQQLEAGERVFVEKLTSRQNLLRFAARATSRDFYFQQLISDSLQDTESNANSLGAALLSQKNRVGADLAIALDIDGNVIANTQPTMGEGIQLSEDLLEAFSDKVDKPILVNIEGLAYQLVLTPIKAPLTIGWLGMGYKIDDKFASYFKELTNLEVTFWQDNNAKGIELFASTLPNNERGLVTDASLWSMLGNEHRIFKVNGREYLSITTSFESPTNTPVTVILQRDMQQALVSFTALKTQISLIAGISILLAALGALAISRSITKPIRELVSVAKRIGSGEYGLPLTIKDKGETGLLAKEFRSMQHQISEREKEINFLAYHDALTGLPNRNQLQQHIDSKLINGNEAHTQSFALLAINIDRIREINDTLGHVAGDELVKQIGERLMLMPNSCQCALAGSNQFFLTFPNTNLQVLPELKLQLQSLFDKPVLVESVSLDIHARVGAAVYPDHGESPEILMQRADISVNVSELNNVFFSIYDTELDQHSVERLALMSELKSAIGRDELALYYQPKLDLSTKTVTHVECLVRWIHPTHGFVNPDQFIPYAEQTGSIRALTRWVLETAIKQYKQWQLNHWDIKVAVNISTVDLLDPKLPVFISDLLLQYQLTTDCIVLEITESAVMSDPERAIATLEEFAEAGIKLSIDDYGTGYSSMTQLKRLTVNELKIDKSFVLELPHNKGDEIIVRSTIELAHQMGLTVVAEGVESDEALQCLTEWKCDMAQGFFISRPTPSEKVTEWLSDCPYEVTSNEPKAAGNAQLN